jgi:hypothetical protein
MSYRRLVLLIVVLGVAAMAIRPSTDTDTFWHLRTGAWIVENREIPRSDPFSSTAAGQPWTSPGWLADVALFEVQQVAGFQGLSLFTAAMAAIALLFLWPLLEGPILLRAAVLLLAAATSAAYWAARPHIATFALASFFLWALARRAHSRWRRVVWLLPVAMILWVNLHGGFAVGFLLLAMVLAGVLIEILLAALSGRMTIRDAWSGHRSDVLGLSAIFLLCLAAGAVANPYGPAILLYPFKTVSIPVLQGRILEWQSPDFHQRMLWPFLMTLALLPLAVGVSNRKLAVQEAVLSIGWMVLALVAVRNVAIFALAAAPVVARHTASGLEAFAAGRRTSAPLRLGGTINAVLGVVLIGVLLVWAAAQLGARRTSDHLDSLVPVAAVKAIESHRPPGNLLNDYNWGAYVLWELYPAYPSFVDGRTDVFPPKVFEDYLALWSASPGWQDLIDSYNIGTVLLPPSAPIVETLVQTGWDPIYQDGRAVVLARP